MGDLLVFKLLEQSLDDRAETRNFKHGVRILYLILLLQEFDPDQNDLEAAFFAFRHKLSPILVLTQVLVDLLVDAWSVKLLQAIIKCLPLNQVA